jgi:O-antigen/teichoic acid export membrane protein
MSDDLVKVAEDSARGGFFLISGSALSTVILAMSAILIGRILGPEMYGQYTLATVVSQLLFLFTDLGINHGITKYTASLDARREAGRITRILKSGLILRAVVGLILFAVNYAFAETFASVFLQRPDLAIYVRIASISVLFQVIFTTATSAFVGLDKSEYNALATSIQALAKTIISIVLVVVGFGVAGAVIGHTASYIVAAVAGGTILYLLVRNMPKDDANPRVGFTLLQDVKVLTYYGAPLYLSLLLTGLIPVYQSFILANFTRDVDVGNFRAASNFTALMAILSIPIATALLPAFSKLDSSREDRQRTFFKLANKYTALLVVPLTVLIITYSSQIVHIVYGATYQSAPSFMITNFLLYFLVGLGYLTLSSFYNGLGQTRITMGIGLLTFILTGVLSPVLTQTYGVQGLISAFLIASSAGTVLGSYVARRKFKIEFDTSSLLKIYLVSAASALPSLLMLRFLSLPSVISLAAGGFLYVLIYATLVPMAKVVTSSELQMAESVTKSAKLLELITKPFLKYERTIMHRMKRK